MLVIADEAYEFIIRQEVTSRAYYERHYRRPEWPGASSGVTVACGYDLGYASPEKIKRDWIGLVSDDMLQAMIHCSGVKGEEARALLPTVKNKIDIPWDAAERVFRNSDIPQWTAAVQRALPNCDKISPLCLGMHVATAYNRGVGGYCSEAPRFTEMRNIHDHMESQRYTSIGAEFRSMRRLWPTLAGLRDRYTETANLWDKGLLQPTSVIQAHPPAQHDGEHPLQAGSARTKPSATSAAQNGTAGSIVGGTVVVATHAAQNGGVPLGEFIMLVVAGVALAGVVWFAWYRSRNPK